MAEKQTSLCGFVGRNRETDKFVWVLSEETKIRRETDKFVRVLSEEGKIRRETEKFVWFFLKKERFAEKEKFVWFCLKKQRLADKHIQSYVSKQ